jgi:hypothetical protein
VRDYGDLPIKVRNKLEFKLDEFDANKVAKILEFLDWKWASAASGVAEPSEVRSLARELLYDAYNGVHDGEEQCTCFCGGLRAMCWSWGDGVEFTISFEAVSA